MSHESVGFLVLPGDVEALAEALGWLLTDEELTSKCGRNAHDRTKREFDVEHSVNRLMAIYDRYGIR